MRVPEKKNFVVHSTHGSILKQRPVELPMKPKTGWPILYRGIETLTELTIWPSTES